MNRQLVEDAMSTEVVSIRTTTPYKDIVRLLTEHRISAMPVVDTQGGVLGIVSEADLLHKVEFAGAGRWAPLFERKRVRTARKRAGADLAEDLMTSPAVIVNVADSVTTAACLMDAKRVKRLPVVNWHSRVVGIVTRTDLLRVYLRDDAEIKAEMCQEVLPRNLWHRPDEVAVTGGVLTLPGLSRRSKLPLVVRLLKGVRGVVSVISRLSDHYDDSADHEHAPVAYY